MKPCNLSIGGDSGALAAVGFRFFGLSLSSRPKRGREPARRNPVAKTRKLEIPKSRRRLPGFRVVGRRRCAPPISGCRGGLSRGAARRGSGCREIPKSRNPETPKSRHRRPAALRAALPIPPPRAPASTARSIRTGSIPSSGFPTSRATSALAASSTTGGAASAAFAARRKRSGTAAMRSKPTPTPSFTPTVPRTSST